MDFRQHLKDSSRIDADDVLSLRREVFDDMVVSLVEAEAVFSLNDAVEETCSEWQEFFVEVMTDYCVNQANPAGYVSEGNADWLVSQITKDGRVKSCTELELLVKIIERATSVPERLSAFALREVAEAVISGDGGLVGDKDLTAGVIGKPEAQLIRRIMYGVGAEGRIAISRVEVEVLFDLNDRTVDKDNHPEWNDVFVKAVGAYLMMGSGYKALGREEVLRREEWLDDTNVDVAGMLSKSLSSVGDLMRGSVWGELARDGNSRSNDAWGTRNEAVNHAASQAAPVDQSEAQWLAERIGRDGVFHENEKALLRFIKEEAEHIDPALEPLFAKIA